MRRQWLYVTCLLVVALAGCAQQPNRLSALVEARSLQNALRAVSREADLIEVGRRGENWTRLQRLAAKNGTGVTWAVMILQCGVAWRSFDVIDGFRFISPEEVVVSMFVLFETRDGRRGILLNATFRKDAQEFMGGIPMEEVPPTLRYLDPSLAKEASGAIGSAIDEVYEDPRIYRGPSMHDGHSMVFTAVIREDDLVVTRGVTQAMISRLAPFAPPPERVERRVNDVER